MDLIFALNTMLEKTWEWNKDRYIALIDMEKAFDRIDRNRLLEGMRSDYCRIEPKLIRAVKSITDVAAVE